MKAWINLETTSLDFRVVAEAHDETTTLFHKGSRIQLPDFATIVTGWEQVESRWRESIAETLMLESRRAPIFQVPETWKMAHVLKALGCFDSVGDARRNGWDKEIPEGMTEHVVRVRKVKGAITTYRPTAAILVPGSWEECDCD